MELTAENYYGEEANREYLSVSQFKDFAGTYGRPSCEYSALEKMYGRWTQKPTKPMLIGSYVDSYFEGPESHRKFREETPEIFTQKGELRAEYKNADNVIARIKRDKYFMKFLSGEKQKIMTAELFGCKWKIKMDSYIEGVAIVDLKIMSSIRKQEWVKDLGYLDFVRYFGYDVQGAVYQKVVEINTGKKLPFYIAAATKEDEPDIAIIQVTQNYLDEALVLVEYNTPRILSLKSGETEPDKCDVCDCCKHNRVLTRPIAITDLMTRI